MTASAPVPSPSDPRPALPAESTASDSPVTEPSRTPRAARTGKQDPCADKGNQPRQPRLALTCAVIYLLGLALVALGARGLTSGPRRTATVAGFGTTIVLGSILVVFAALLPWLADGPVRLGPLALTLRIRGRAARRRRWRRR